MSMPNPLYQRLGQLACEGNALLVVLSELIGRCCRILVMLNVRLAGEIACDDSSKIALMWLIAGVAAA